MRIFSTIAAIGAAALFGGSAYAAGPLGIATSNPGSLYHNIGTAIAKAANSHGLNVTIQPATSPNQYLPAVGGGQFEFGIANLQEYEYALQGQAWFKGHASPGLRVVALLYPLKEAIFVRKDSTIKSVGDLKGKRMTDGFTAQHTIIPQLEAIYATAGLTRNDITKVQVPSVVAGANAFMAGQSDGFIFAQGAGKVREADAAVGGIRALPVPNTPESVAAIKKQSTSNFQEDKTDHTWMIYFAAFLKRPLNDVEYTIKFYELGGGGQRLLGTSDQFNDERGQKTIVSKIKLDKKSFGVNKELLMTIENKGTVYASARFKILGEGERFSGKVNFSEDEAGDSDSDGSAKKK